MKYDFDSIIDRWNTDSYKWNIREGELPMWVADMDFEVAPEIKEAMNERIEHGVFGYSVIPDRWYEAYQNWWRERHHFDIEKNWLVFCTGVVPAISTCVRKLTEVGDNVLVQTPVYNIFFNSIRNNARNIVASPLKLTSLHYEMDFDDLEKKLSDHKTTLMLLCNPQNPSGMIWDKDTLLKVGELCARYDVIVLSDEIHCDITEPGTEYVPFASVAPVCRDNSVTCISASKAFNMAGLQSAAVVVPDKELRRKVWRALNTDEVAEPNSFAVTSTVAAFEKGGAWLDELREYIADNRRLVRDYINANIPELSLIEGKATYLLWIDARKIINAAKSSVDNGRDTSDKKKLSEFIREKTGLYLSDGEEYGTEGFLRMNVACPRSVVSEGLRRLEAGVRAYITV